MSRYEVEALWQEYCRLGRFKGYRWFWYLTRGPLGRRVRSSG